uniref:Uncharacterized protein n=1 Tax=Anguilla anguilla TaxID=7936 RepID=A0A0E9XC24_ANGAN
MSPLRVSQNHPLHPTVFYHCRADLPSEGALRNLVAVLCSHPNRRAQIRPGKVKVDSRGTTDHLGVGIELGSIQSVDKIA